MDRVLVPLDDSPQSSAALEFTLEEFPTATAHLLHVIDPVEGSTQIGTGLPTASEEWFEKAQSNGEALLAGARERATAAGVDVETMIKVGRPASTIVEQAGETGAEGIVMGSHGRAGVSRVLLGSVAERVIRRSPIPVTVVR